MGKHTVTKRLSSSYQSASKAIDIKARKRIEHLYELTDEIINAYNEINDKYVHQIYRKYMQVKEMNKKLKEKLLNHHCSGCKCRIQSNDDDEEEGEEEEEEEESNSSAEEDNEKIKDPALPSSTTNSATTRDKKKNPFIISDIDETQIFDDNDGRLNNRNKSDDDEDKTSMDTDQNAVKTTSNGNESEQQSDGEVDENNGEDDGMARLPFVLRDIIRNKAKKNKNAKMYLLQIPRYPALCEFLRDKSHRSFDHRPNEDQVRPLIENHISQTLALDKTIRQRVRDELREIHRSYMRTFMTDPHYGVPKPGPKNTKLVVKKSPM